MKIVISALLAAGLLGGCTEPVSVDMTGRAAALAKTIAEERDHVTVSELADWIIKDRRDFELVDIRAKADLEAGQIRGARHVPLAALLSEASLAALPPGRKVVVYSNGTAHAAQAALLLRLVDRHAYALLGGFNHWQAYLNNPDSAGAAEMDPVERAEYQAVACYFAGNYVAAAGLVPNAAGDRAAAAEPPSAESDALGLGLGLGLGSEEVKGMGQGSDSTAQPPQPAADPLGLGLDLGLGGEAAKSLQKAAPKKPAGTAGKLLIKAEC